MTEFQEIPGWMLLRIDPSRVERPVYFVVDHTLYHDPSCSAEKEADLMRYSVEEGTCPSNLVRVEAIIEVRPDGYDDDPHGVLEFVAWAPKPADWTEQSVVQDWREVFPCLSRDLEGAAEPVPFSLVAPAIT